MTYMIRVQAVSPGEDGMLLIDIEPLIGPLLQRLTDDAALTGPRMSHARSPERAHDLLREIYGFDPRPEAKTCVPFAIQDVQSLIQHLVKVPALARRYATAADGEVNVWRSTLEAIGEGRCAGLDVAHIARAALASEKIKFRREDPDEDPIPTPKKPPTIQAVCGRLVAEGEPAAYGTLCGSKFVTTVAKQHGVVVGFLCGACKVIVEDQGGEVAPLLPPTIPR